MRLKTDFEGHSQTSLRELCAALSGLVFPRLAEAREQSSLSELKAQARGLVEALEGQAEFVNEQKESLKIVHANVESAALFLERLALWFHVQRLRKGVFYALKRHRTLKRRAPLHRRIVAHMRRKRRLRGLFAQWRARAFARKRSRRGKEMILGFKVR